MKRVSQIFTVIIVFIYINFKFLVVHRLHSHVSNAGIFDGHHEEEVFANDQNSINPCSLLLIYKPQFYRKGKTQHSQF